jgi:hypothetical protein
MTSQNPYTSMLVKFNADCFYGRADEIISILGVITGTHSSGHAIYGIRTIGKTTLLRYLKAPTGALQKYADYVSPAYRPGGGKHLLFVYHNFHSYSKDDGSIFHVMLNELADELFDDPRIGDQVEVPYFAPEEERGTVLEGLRKVLATLSTDWHTRIVFFLDDFDMPLTKNIIDADDDNLLRTLSDSAALIISTEEPISILRPDMQESSPLLGILRPEVIDLLKVQEARELINDPLGGLPMSFSEAEQKFLIEVGGRQPFTLTAACELYYNMRQEYPDLGEMLHDSSNRTTLQIQFVSRLVGLPHVHKILQMTWEKLKDTEKQALQQMANGLNTTVNGSRNTIAGRLTNKSLVYLDLRHGIYCIFSEVFAYFVRQVTSSDIEGPTIHINKHEKNTQPPEKVVNNLSPIDRSVLEYLTAHANQTCTFDELLDAVWEEEEEKSKRALEASVYRLRRSIGNYGAIKNVRGKGYKFTSEGMVSAQ